MTRLHACWFVVLLGACDRDRAPSANTDTERSKATTPSGPVEELGELSSSDAIDLRQIVNKTPEEVDAVLGEPSETGSDRVSCVRFEPERVFFACEQQIRLYTHPQFELIRVEFEDGHAATIALAGLPGAGAFDPNAALAVVGIQLPGEPKHDNPALSMGTAEDVVDRWEWGNSRARLRVDGLEQRVRLTVVNGDWRRAKLELINNQPLTDEQRARIKQARLPAGD